MTNDRNWTLEEQKAHRKEWVNALRSGKFMQGRKALHIESTNSYCCLGVACVVAGKKIPAVKRPVGENDGYDDKYLVLSEEVQDYYGLNSSNGEYESNSNLVKSLTIDNDDNNLDFNQIADIIEAEPEGLFIK